MMNGETDIINLYPELNYTTDMKPVFITKSIKDSNGNLVLTCEESKIYNETSTSEQTKNR